MGADGSLMAAAPQNLLPGGVSIAGQGTWVGMSGDICARTGHSSNIELTQTCALGVLSREAVRSPGCHSWSTLYLFLSELCTDCTPMHSEL